MKIQVVFLLLASLACSSNGTTLDPRNQFSTRDEAYINGNMFLDVRITSGAREVVNTSGGGRLASEIWNAEVLGFLNRPGAVSSATGTTVQVVLPAWEEAIATGDRRSLNRSQYGVDTFVQGQRYLIVALSYSCFDNPATRVIPPTKVYRVRGDGQLDQSALGYPSGTPMSVVLDRATVPPTDMFTSCPLHPDAGVNGAVDGG